MCGAMIDFLAVKEKMNIYTSFGTCRFYEAFETFRKEEILYGVTVGEFGFLLHV